MQCRMVMAMKAYPVPCNDVIRILWFNKTACINRKMNHVHIVRHVLHGLMMAIRMST
jgi:hypothetical protein